MAIMPDDISMLLGEMRGVQRALEQRLDRQDAETLRAEEKRAAEAQRTEEKREKDKQEAIAARNAKESRDDQKHAENTIRLETMDRKLTTTYGQSSVNDQWINRDGKPAAEWVETEGKPLVARVVVLEGIQEKKRLQTTAERNRRLGAAAVWGSVAAAVGGLATLVGLIGLDGVAAVLARVARAMGAS